MLAVKTGLKPCFLFCRELCESRKEINALEQMAVFLKLQHKITITPPLYYSSEPKVSSNFLKAYYSQTCSETLWVYHDSTVEAKIEKCISGKLNEGYILGYPECCIKWHEEYRTLEVESDFQDLESHITRNPFVLSSCQVDSEEEFYDQILRMAYPKEANEKVWVIINKHLLETYKKYPYVPHWSCSACLRGKSKETEILDAKYGELLRKIDPKFQSEFLSSVKQAIQEFEKQSPNVD